MIERQQHFDAWQRSGLTKQAYCRQHAITVSAFYYWIKHNNDNRYWHRAIQRRQPARIARLTPSPNVAIISATFRPLRASGVAPPVFVRR
ncbi:IS66 family insertion sequence element accessory protein TnpA [Martelella alba]|uniref:IS66 family insertion sequence element accessory protein TnpA n=1 Tax=Martelella alba TaxID=2590451 RepID=UPI00403C5094